MGMKCRMAIWGRSPGGEHPESQACILIVGKQATRPHTIERDLTVRRTTSNGSKKKNLLRE